MAVAGKAMTPLAAFVRAIAAVPPDAAGGLLGIFAGFAPGETAGTRTMFILTGLIWVAFGVVLFAHPDAGAVTLALLFGLFSLIAGGTMITQGIELHRTSKTLHSVTPEATKVA
jgi:uncharacterized membrane protein HdeD (DUF308 family)